MAINGRIGTITNADGTEAIFPRTKTSAITDSAGKNLDTILSELKNVTFYSAEFNKKDVSAGTDVTKNISFKSGGFLWISMTENNTQGGSGNIGFLGIQIFKNGQSIRRTTQYIPQVETTYGHVSDSLFIPVAAEDTIKIVFQGSAYFRDMHFSAICTSEMIVS